MLAGAAVLMAGLAIAPGRLDLPHWPAQRTEWVSYAGWLQMLGADVSRDGDHLRVSTVYQTGNAANAKPVISSVRLMTRETVWASATETLPADGWVTAVPRRFAYDLTLPPGTPAGVYLLELELRWASDNGILGQEWTKLSFGAPRVGTVTMGPLSLTTPITGRPSAESPASTDFGPLDLVAWQPPINAEQGQFVPIDLWWRPKEAPPADWGISLHVVDAQGQVWAGHDDQPRQGYNPTSWWPAGQLERDVQMAILPGGMPPGEYTIQAGWYDVATKAPVGPQNVTVGHISVGPASHPDAGLLDIPHHLNRALPQGLSLLGYDVQATHVMAGQQLPLRLFWEAKAQPAADYRLTLSFNGRSETMPLPATSQWQAGQLMETRLFAPVPADWSGSGKLGLSLDGSPAAVELPDTVNVDPLPRLTSLPDGLKRVEPSTLGGVVSLAGYKETIGGGKLQLTLYWQPLASVPPNLVVFTHVLDAQNRVVAQHDGVPAGGRRPTGTWAPGEYVEDAHDLSLPSDRSGLRVEVGLYDPATGQRLGDRLLLGPPAA